MKTAQCFYDLTDYPKIYNSTYWGDFNNANNRIKKEIITNRNNFVKDFDIANVKTIPKKYQKYFYLEFETRYNEYKKLFDHVEQYRTNNNGYVVICSPYSQEDEIAEKLGYKKYKNMYCYAGFTYVKVLIQ